MYSTDGYRYKPTYGRHAANKHNDSMSDVCILVGKFLMGTYDNTFNIF